VAEAPEPGWPEKQLLLARWSEAERQVYTLALTAPERYELYVGLVRAVADELAAVTSQAELFDAYTGAAALVARVAERNRVEGVSFDPLAGAAFALRYREIVAGD
jgi:hypothetical protein